MDGRSEGERSRIWGLQYMTFTEFLDFLTPLPSSSATFILLIRKYAVFLDPLPLLFGRHIWKPPLSLSGVTLSRTTSSGNSVRNLPSSTFSSLPPNSGDALCCLPSFLPSLLSSDSEMPTTSVLLCSAPAAVFSALSSPSLF